MIREKNHPAPIGDRHDIADALGDLGQLPRRDLGMRAIGNEELIVPGAVREKGDLCRVRNEDRLGIRTGPKQTRRDQGQVGLSRRPSVPRHL
ncbi:MAG: hypothetical protein ACYCWW_06015 [Deltaproteobacteria bacterium]